MLAFKDGRDMEYCYLCNTSLIGQNISDEHILLNALGGRLKSKKLICRSCNSGHGNGCDAALAKQLSPLAILLDVKRDRGKNPNLSAKTLDEMQDLIVYPGAIGAEFKPCKPIETRIDEHTINLKISAPSIEVAKQQLEGYKRKYPNLDVREFLDSMTVSETGLNSQFRVTFDGIGGKEAQLSALKSVINYYLMLKKDMNYINNRPVATEKL